MVCPVCPVAGFAGGYLGGYFGINPPDHWQGKAISAFITANLMAVTVVGLKYFFDASLCSPGRTTMERVVVAGVKAILLGVVYSIGVNYLLGRYVYTGEMNPEEEADLLENETDLNGEQEKPPVPEKHCCCKKMSE